MMFRLPSVLGITCIFLSSSLHVGGIWRAVEGAAATPSYSTTLSDVTNEDGTKTYTALTQPLPLYPGEISNTWHHISIPKGPIAISQFGADVVEWKNDETKEEVIPVPLSQVYLHHQVVYSSHDHYNQQRNHKKRWVKPTGSETNVQRGVGFGAGSESRGTPQVFPAPYRFTTVRGEDELIANVHIINTRNMTSSQAQQCLECPCTEQDHLSQTEIQQQSQKKHWWQRTPPPPKYPDSTLREQVMERRHHWDRCNAQLLNASNTACSPDTYHGGLLCCDHGEFCLNEYYLDSSHFPPLNKKTGMRPPSRTVTNETQSTFYLRYTITYEPINNKNQDDITPLYLASCCDATGNLTDPGNIEYDIPQLCNHTSTTSTSATATATNGTTTAIHSINVASPLPANCIHTLETIQTLHGDSYYYSNDNTPSSSSKNDNNENDEKEELLEEWVDVVYMVGHLQPGGLEMVAFFANNGTTICRSVPTYGNGTNTNSVGNEAGYIVRMSTCTFDPPLRMKTTDQIRIVSQYNAAQARTGVMSLFYIALASVDDDDPDELMTIARTEMGFWKRFQRLASLLGLVIVARASYKTFNQHTNAFRRGYEQVPSSLIV